MCIFTHECAVREKKVQQLFIGREHFIRPDGEDGPLKNPPISPYKHLRGSNWPLKPFKINLL